MPLAEIVQRPARARGNRRPAWLALLALALAQPAVSGCVSYGPPSPTAVAQGKYFSTGNPDYDEFFVRLFRLQVALAQAPAELERTRAALAKKLDVAADADALALETALVARSAELRARGVNAHVALNGETPPALTLVQSGITGASVPELVARLEETLAELNTLRRALPAWHRELEVLPPRGVTLESGIEAAFIGTGRAERSDIRDNLADAQKIMGLMGPRLKELDAKTSALAESLLRAFPAPVVVAKEPPPAEPEPKPKPRPHRNGGARPAAPKPKPAPNGASAEAPPPKPVQGTAKPDFEP